MFLIKRQLGLRKKRSAVIHFTSVATSEIVVCGGDVSLGRRRALASDAPLLILRSSSLKYHNFDTAWDFEVTSAGWAFLFYSFIRSSCDYKWIWCWWWESARSIETHFAHLEEPISAVLDVSVVSLLVAPSCQQNVWLNQKCIWDLKKWTTIMSHVDPMKIVLELVFVARHKFLL